MLDNLAGEPLFGTVKLLKSERGAVAALCDRLRPPKEKGGVNNERSTSRPIACRSEKNLSVG